MKKTKFIGLFLSLVSFVMIASCGKGGNTPVDQYVAAIEQATEQLKNLSDSDNINTKDIPPQKALDISEKYADYKLTDDDKEKLKKSFDKYVKALFEQLANQAGLPESMKPQIKNQSKLVLEAINAHIEEAATMADLGRVD